MKIAVVRGASLNQFEMQYFEPMAKEHEIVCFGSKEPVYDTAGINLPIIKLPCLGQILGKIPGTIKALYLTLGDPQGLIGLEKRLSGFDIAHTAELFSYYTHQALLAKKEGKVKKVVATVSENIPFNQEWYPRQKALKKYALVNLDHILTISSLSKRALITEGYPEEKISVVPHGLDLRKFKPEKKDEKLAKKLGFKKDDFIVLSVGRLVPEKGMADLLRTCKKLLAEKEMERTNLKVLIIGRGKEKENLIKLREKLSLKNIVFFKQSLPYNQMAKVYNLADIFVLASKPTPFWQEQFGMVLIESMACGIPVISTRSGAISETVGEAGVLVTPGNWFELDGAVKKLIFDKGLRQSLAEKGRKRVEKKFDRVIVAKKIEKIYKRVLAEDGGIRA